MHCGTPGYVAPDILQVMPYDTQANMWSLAVIVSFARFERRSTSFTTNTGAGVDRSQGLDLIAAHGRTGRTEEHHAGHHV